MTAKAATAKSRPGDTIVDRLRKLGVRGVLVQMAKCRQIIELQCEMPNCYCPNGRTHFDPKTHPPGPWDPSADHYPKLKSDGGQLVAWNVRLSHVRCNQEDYVWRGRIRRMLEQGMSLDEIAQKLNDRAIHAPHGGGGWSAATVRKAFVS
jgi:Recombinase